MWHTPYFVTFELNMKQNTQHTNDLDVQISGYIYNISNLCDEDFVD